MQIAGFQKAQYLKKDLKHEFDSLDVNGNSILLCLTLMRMSNLLQNDELLIYLRKKVEVPIKSLLSVGFPLPRSLNLEFGQETLIHLFLVSLMKIQFFCIYNFTKTIFYKKFIFLISGQ